MDIRVYRQNLWQVGGCVTEIRTRKARIIIDFGQELPDESAVAPAETPRIDGLNTDTSSNVAAVFFTHYHLDHIGSIQDIRPDIPLYMGSDAVRLFANACRRHAPRMLPAALRVRRLKGLLPVQVGDMTVTPIPCDHSAYDSMMYLVESGGVKVLHTGDFRMHGFKGTSSSKLLQKRVGKVDALILEGTTLGRLTSHALSEYALHQQIREAIRKNKYCFVLCSSSHIERLASISNATPRGHYFVCDAYQKQVFDIVASSARSRHYRFKKALALGSNLKLREHGFVMPVRVSDQFADIMHSYQEEAVLLYSMWDGYLEDASGAISRFVAPYRNAGRIFHLHTSGHADEAGLRQVVELTRPDIVIPIHTQLPCEMRRIVPAGKLELFLEGDWLTL